ncbi:vacuolar import and degradation protein-domain-containing protein, partial [Lineolata rhizophorae]
MLPHLSSMSRSNLLLGGERDRDRIRQRIPDRDRIRERTPDREPAIVGRYGRRGAQTPIMPASLQHRFTPGISADGAGTTSARAAGDARMAAYRHYLDSPMREAAAAANANLSNRGASAAAALLPSPEGASPYNGALERAIKYLSRVRWASSWEEAVAIGVETGVLDRGAVFDLASDRGDLSDTSATGNVPVGGVAWKDLVLDPCALPRPSETSWLVPGAVFSGSQHATSGRPAAGRDLERTYAFEYVQEPGVSSSVMNPRIAHAQRYHHGRNVAGGRDAPSGAGARGSAYGYGAAPSAAPPVSAWAQENWPVRVTIHAVDYEHMTVAATMEAYNVPSVAGVGYVGAGGEGAMREAGADTDRMEGVERTGPARTQAASSGDNNNNNHGTHPPSTSGPTTAPSAPPASTSSPRTTSITTYLEGEILDFTTYTLRTESFRSSLENDAKYWRKLPPFRDAGSDDEVVRTLLSRGAMEHLAEKYVLMRWKERCFVAPDGGVSGGSNATANGTAGATAFGTTAFGSATGRRRPFLGAGREGGRRWRRRAERRVREWELRELLADASEDDDEGPDVYDVLGQGPPLYRRGALDDALEFYEAGGGPWDGGFRNNAAAFGGGGPQRWFSGGAAGAG